MPEIPNVLSLEGRVAVVTGAGRGVGAATARLLSRAGAQVALLDRDAAGVTHTAEQIALGGGEALSFTNDITDAFAVERTFDRVVDEWGRLDARGSLPVVDGLLAATARVHDLTLVTRNVKDVVRTGVDLLDPFEPTAR